MFLLRKNKFVIFFIIVLITGCHNPNTLTFKLPSDSLVNQVIYEICNNKEIIHSENVIISKQLCPYTLYYQKRRIHDYDVPPSPPKDLINPIAPLDLITFFKSKVDDSICASDSNYLKLQIQNSTKKFLNNTIFKNFQLATITFNSFKDYCRNDSIIVFYYPIFFSQNYFVYINIHFKRYGEGVILQKVNKDWIVYTVFDTWNVD
jgi:hypothetical protein